jgi:hypothetical protein
MKNLIIGQALAWLAIASTSASIARIVLHHLRGGLVIWVELDEKNPSPFWRIYAKFEATAARFSLALGKFARKGDRSKLLVIPDTKAAINEALETAGELREGQKSDARTVVR